MSAESFLTSMIEAAVGMAGFAGIVAAVRDPNIARWPLDQRLLLRMLLVASAAVVGFSLAPAVLREIGLPDPILWRIASAALLSWQIFMYVHRTRQFRQDPTPRPFSWKLRIWVGGILVLQLVNLALGVAWPYLLGVFGVLGNAFSFFLYLLLGGERGEGAVE